MRSDVLVVCHDVMIGVVVNHRDSRAFAGGHIIESAMLGTRLLSPPSATPHRLLASLVPLPFFHSLPGCG